MFWHSLHGGQRKNTQLCVSFTHYSCPIIRSRAILSNPTTNQYRNCHSLTRPLQMTHYKDWGVRCLPEPAHETGLMQTVIIFGNRALQLSGLCVVVWTILTHWQSYRSIFILKDIFLDTTCSPDCDGAPLFLCCCGNSNRTETKVDWR